MQLLFAAVADQLVRLRHIRPGSTRQRSDKGWQGVMVAPIDPVLSPLYESQSFESQ